MKRLAKPRGWEHFQHYKDRRPPWIKLHKSLLDDRDFQRLPVASRALAPMLWLLASESDDSSLDVSIEELTFRLRQSESEIVAGLKPLIDAGFFSLEQPAGNVLADCEQLAPQRREETEAEAEGEKPHDKPALAPKAKREKLPELTFADWSERVKASGEKLISGASVWAYAKSINLPDEFVSLAWFKFKHRYLTDARYTKKRYADWRQTFRNSVEGNWFDLWYVNRGGEFQLKTEGEQAIRELTAYENAMQAQEVAT